MRDREETEVEVAARAARRGSLPPEPSADVGIGEPTSGGLANQPAARFGVEQLRADYGYGLGHSLQGRSLRQTIGEVGVDQVEDAGVCFRPQHGKAGAKSPSLIGHQGSQNFGTCVASVSMAIAGGNVVEAVIYGVGNFVGNALATVAVTGAHSGQGICLHDGFHSCSELSSSAMLGHPDWSVCAASLK